jgi:23S rRNA (adenine2503-C2)-methyltransferase
MSIDELALYLGGRGRARLAWDCYAIGVDPAMFYGSTIQLGHDDFETILELLPSNRRSQRLGPEALQKLAATYVPALATVAGGSATHTNSGSNPTDMCNLQVEGGVAALSYVSQSSDQTTKLLLRLADGLEIETVIIPWNGTRSTLCMSTQVGCRQACTFCATGRMGLHRSLTSDEILAQMFFAKKICRLYHLPEVTNIVFMGMGEAADNVDAVTQAARILTTRELFQLSATKVTVSTVAPTPESFRQVSQAPVVLAWSVHAVRDDLRKLLVPTTKYPMTELRQGLIDALQDKPKHLRTAMLEVALMENVNDSIREASELADFCRVIMDSVPQVKLIVNLIPYNPTGHARFRTPSAATVEAFQRHLWSEGIYAHVRKTRGDEKSAACGQLATKKKKRQRLVDEKTT